MTKLDEHEFGGNWTVIKLELLERYLNSFNTALKNRPSESNRFKRIYIDAFAGTGKCSVSIDGENLNIDGSAKIALEANPPFDEFYFIDMKRKHVKALTQLANNHQERSIKVFGGDCNAQIDAILNNINWRSSRAVMPYKLLNRPCLI